MSDNVFIDTNVLVYAHDAAAGEKYDVAARLVIECWEGENAVISTQVLQELYVTLTQKVSPAVSPSACRALVERYQLWEVVVNDVGSLLRASHIQGDHQLSFWDSLIIDAAQNSGCETLYSEDLSHGQRYGAVRVVNPFAH